MKSVKKFKKGKKRNPSMAGLRRWQAQQKAAKKGGGGRRKFRRNPVSVRGTVSSFTNAAPKILKPAAVAAVGAIVLDGAWGYLPIPVQVKTGAVSHVVKGFGAIVLGVLGSRVVGRETAMQFGTGAMAVVLYGVMRSLIPKYFPQVHLGMYPNAIYPELAYVSSGQRAMDGLAMYDQADGSMLNPPGISLPQVGVTALSSGCADDDDDGLGIYDR